VFKLIIDNSSFGGSDRKSTQATIHAHLECKQLSSLKVGLGSQLTQQTEKLNYEAALSRVISRAQKLDW